jgi:branched-chain amino acid transport system substrate-binding protein
MKRKSLWPKYLFIVLGVFLISGLRLAGSVSHAAEKNIRLGFSLSISGIFAAATPSQMKAYQLWAEQINERGGIYLKGIGKRLPVELVYYDDKSKPEEAIRIYERLITQDKVDLLFAPWGTNHHVAIVPTVERYRVPLVGNTAVSTKLKQLKARYFWFLSALPEEIMRNLIDLLIVQKDKIKKVGVLYVHGVFETDLHNFLIPFLEKGGFEIVMDKDYPLDVKDLSSVLLELKGKKPDALIALTEAEDVILMFSQMMEIGLDPTFLYFLLGPGWAAWPQMFSNATDGVTFFTGNAWTREGPGPGSAEFYDSYVKRWGENPDYLDTVFPWVSCQVVEQALEKAGTLDWEKLRKVIATEKFITLWGSVEFKGSFNVHGTPGVLQWQKGEVELVWPSNLATSELVIPKPPFPKKK